MKHFKSAFVCDGDEQDLSLSPYLILCHNAEVRHIRGKRRRSSITEGLYPCTCKVELTLGNEVLDEIGMSLLGAKRT